MGHRGFSPVGHHLDRINQVFAADSQAFKAGVGRQLPEGNVSFGIFTLPLEPLFPEGGLPALEDLPF